jgi:uncharacterized membrane protein
MRVASIGHAAFAASMIALGMLGLVQADIVAIFEPLPKIVPARVVLAYVSAAVALACGIGLVWQRSAALAARMLLTFLMIWMLLFRVPVLFFSPKVVVSWESCSEIVVAIAAAWVLCGIRGLRIARSAYGLALFFFGLSHFVYLKDTADLVPAWLPGHAAWACFFGGTYMAAALALLLDVYARLAAALATLQMGMFTLLVWLPLLATGSSDSFQWSEGVLSCVLTAGAWVLADSYRGVPWLAARRTAMRPAGSAG